MGVTLFQNGGQRYIKNRSLAFPALDPDPPLLALQHPLRDREAQPFADREVGVEPVEDVEHLGLVLRRIKADPDLRKLPVIMLTTTDDARDVDRCHHLGCNEYIQKPVDYDKFAEAIQRLGQFVTLLLIPTVGAH